MWLLAVFCLLVGLVLGFQLPVMRPGVYQVYVHCRFNTLDSVFGELEPMEDSLII